MNVSARQVPIANGAPHDKYAIFPRARVPRPWQDSDMSDVRFFTTGFVTAERTGPLSVTLLTPSQLIVVEVVFGAPAIAARLDAGEPVVDVLGGLNSLQKTETTIPVSGCNRCGGSTARMGPGSRGRTIAAARAGKRPTSLLQPRAHSCWSASRNRSRSVPAKRWNRPELCNSHGLSFSGQYCRWSLRWPFCFCGIHNESPEFAADASPSGWDPPVARWSARPF